MNKLSYIFITISFVGVFLFSVVNMVRAEQSILPGDSSSLSTDSCRVDNKTACQTDPACKKYCGYYEVNDFLGLFKKYYDRAFGLVGGLTLLMFVVGGLMFVFSGGNKSLIERGRTTIIGAAIGLAVVFFAFTITKYIFDSVVGDSWGDDPFTSGVDQSRAPTYDSSDVTDDVVGD